MGDSMGKGRLAWLTEGSSLEPLTSKRCKQVRCRHFSKMGQEKFIRLSMIQLKTSRIRFLSISRAQSSQRSLEKRKTFSSAKISLRRNRLTKRSTRNLWSKRGVNLKRVRKKKSKS